MFDFFRDILLESQGIDSDKAQREKQGKREQKKLARFIFSRSAKTFIYIVGGFYIALAVFNIVSLWGTESKLSIVKYVFLSLVDLSILVSLAINKKRSEIYALIVIVVFLILLYVSIYLM